MDLSGPDTGVAIVNLIIWTGIFLWLLRLNKRLKDVEKMEKEP
jgi:CcmD family protein